MPLSYSYNAIELSHTMPGSAYLCLGLPVCTTVTKVYIESLMRLEASVFLPHLSHPSLFLASYHIALVAFIIEHLLPPTLSFPWRQNGFFSYSAVYSNICCLAVLGRTCKCFTVSIPFGNGTK